MPEEKPCWLVEAAWSRQQPAYLSVSTIAHQYRFDWTFDPNLALRFADRQSCDMVAMAVRALRPELFPTVVPMPTYTEHVFGLTLGGTAYTDRSDGTSSRVLPEAQ
jgi:hypothetical protein